MPILGVLSKSRVPVKIWSPLAEVESASLDQLSNIANLPFVFKHVAAMPDVHLGKGATVGSVVATQKAICPCAVGVDIGCGVAAILTDLNKDLVLDNLPKLRAGIERRTPVGFASNQKLSTTTRQWSKWDDVKNISYMDDSLFDKAQLQIGSLGGGNHFQELCLDTEGRVWVMLHSGSRNLGKTIAERHMDKAKAEMRKMFISLPDPDLSYFVQGTDDFRNYWSDLQIIQEYALENRNEMMRRIVLELEELNGGPFKTLMSVNCHHNYASMENHFNENVIVTRKGAVKASLGQLGVVPGSMGTKSYIVRGLGNPQSFHSCSHGAGRRMSRSKAKLHFTLADLEEQTAGVECRKDLGVLDEIPGAYKDIDQVMENQNDLVEIVATLKQVLCVKG